MRAALDIIPIVRLPAALSADIDYFLQLRQRLQERGEYHGKPSCDSLPYK